MKSIRTTDALLKSNLISADQTAFIDAVSETFLTTISPQMYEKIEKSNQNCPVGQQFIPSEKELHETPNELSDPIGDETHSPVKGIVHRYPDRCLLKPVDRCAVYCRFCFRREQIGAGNKALTSAELEAAYQYIRDHQEIWEVILTGGDPFILKPVQIKKILLKLHAIPHVEIIRFHTRIPVVESNRINAEMIAALKSIDKPVYIILHANHVKEFTEEAKIACAALVDAGIPLLSQTVLLKNINDNIEALSDLMRCFVRNRIKPYYLHHGDLARGTAHFRTSISHGQMLMKQLQGRFSGLCQPQYVLDIPGGYGKIPIQKNYITKSSTSENTYCVEDYCGHQHVYISDE